VLELRSVNRVPSAGGGFINTGWCVGGAFNNNSRNLRAAYRNNNHPDNRNNNIGFRVVVSTDFDVRKPRRVRLARRDEERPNLVLAAPLVGAGEDQRPRALVRLARGHLFHRAEMTSRLDDVVSWENLLLAYRMAARGKRGRIDVAAFDHRLEDHLFTLQDEILAGTYRPGAYRSFHIHEPKHRLIFAAPFRDRVVHHALCQVIEPGFERTFAPWSFANRVGKGTHRALDRAQRLSRRYPFVLQCDIRQFFPSLDHALLLDALQRQIADPRLFSLVTLIVASGEGVLSGEYVMTYFAGDDLFAARPVTEGVPFLGFVVDPWRRRLKGRKVIARRRFVRLAARWHTGEASTEEVAASVRGWINHVRYGNTVGLRKAVLGDVRLTSRATMAGGSR